ncbi:M16 family metallopeptidase [Algicella marina]|uniref:Insulinase family protein n=1 Tax=Algicella marina TaxID=2683284 RepID=A0A6P1T537_9RHOB|nr:pitrilysin family protein [Algicella marina]QHQ35662.1 insulinase family protein [Algicella marina]
MSVQIHRLANGMRVVTEAMPGLGSASVGVWVNVGCRHETVEQNGIAHFLEHMAFKGTKRRNSLEIAEAIEDVGGYLNAYTSREMTAYYARVLREDVALAIDVISDILTGSVFDPREIEVERGVILSEIGQALDTPDDIIFDWLQEVSYPDQPMGRPILGPAERVRAFRQADLATFVETHYGPEQLILSAAGAVDHEEIVRLAETHFGHIPRRSAPQAVPASFLGGERREIKSLEQAHFSLALDGPSYRHEDIYTAQIYAGLMGGGMSSRLFQEVREKRGLCYTIFAQPGAYADGGSLMFYAGTAEAEIAELVSVVVDELRRVPETLNQAEVERARAQMKAGLLMGLESPSSRAERTARMLAIWDRVPTLEETIERIDAVTSGDVSAFAERLCVQADPALALYGPVAAAPGREALKERLAA